MKIDVVHIDPLTTFRESALHVFAAHIFGQG
jgi:hypothetical protein